VGTFRPHLKNITGEGCGDVPSPPKEHYERGMCCISIGEGCGDVPSPPKEHYERGMCCISIGEGCGDVPSPPKEHHGRGVWGRLRLHILP
jgi:hypothetical protein